VYRTSQQIPLPAAYVDIIKLFYEEPFYLEPLTDERDPDPRRAATELGAIDALLPADFSERARPETEDDFSEDALARPTPYYRAYLAGTDLGSGRVGATALQHPEVWARALTTLWEDRGWWTVAEGELVRHEAPGAAALLTGPDASFILAVGQREPFAEALARAASQDRRHSVGHLKRLLDDGAAVIIREPAHHGFDWSIFSDSPLKDALGPGIAREASKGTRVFAVPYHTARSEHKFYFEQWALDDLPGWVEEIPTAEQAARG